MHVSGQFASTKTANKYAKKPVIRDANGVTLKSGKDYTYQKNGGYTYDEDTIVTVKTGKGKKAVTTQVFRRAGDKVQKTDILPVGAVIRLQVNGKGNYFGKLSQTFTVASAKVSKLKFVINGGKAYEYTGERILPGPDDITVMIKQGGKWTEVDPAQAKDYYTITGYGANTKAGKASVTLRAKNGYAGTKTLTFRIKKAPAGSN